jgi:dihydrofolate reductase
MANTDSRVTIHMAASLDGFIARKDGRVDWLETSDEFAGGETMDPGFVEAFLKTIDCYVMGSRTYETALSFEAKGLGWSYGDKPTFVLTGRDLPRTRDTVEFYSGDLAQFVNGRLRPAFRTIWFVGGGVVSGECLRLGLADEVRYSILPILIGDGIPFFEKLDRDIALHLAEVKAYKRHGGASLRGARRSRRVTERHLTIACSGWRCTPPVMLNVKCREDPGCRVSRLEIESRTDVDPIC